jgi:integrase
VDLSNEAVRVLRAHLTRRREETLRRGWRALPARFFCGKDGTDTAPTGVREAFYRVCLAAGLSQKRPAAERQVAAGTIGKPTATERLVPRFTPHGLRHTYAALHLQHGTDVYYVSRQLGHADIALTVGTYGAWLRPNRRAAVDALDRIAAETPSEALA